MISGSDSRWERGIYSPKWKYIPLLYQVTSCLYVFVISTLVWGFCDLYMIPSHFQKERITTNVFLHFAMVRRFMYCIRGGWGFNQAARLLRRDLRFYVVLARLNLYCSCWVLWFWFSSAAPSCWVQALGSQLSMVLNRAVKRFFIHMSNTELTFCVCNTLGWTTSQ